jgi:hypothetical protein
MTLISGGDALGMHGYDRKSGLMLPVYSGSFGFSSEFTALCAGHAL